MKVDSREDEKSPLYLQLIERVRSQVASGELKSGDRLPSISELRKSHGLCKNTIERAHLLLEQEGIVVRKQGRGTFIAERPAPAPRTSKGVIGYSGMFHMFESSSPYWTHLLKGVHEAMAPHNLQLLLLDKDDPDEDGKADGVLVNGLFAQPHPNWLEGKWPCVSVLCAPFSSAVNTVTIDDYAGVREVMGYLVGLGHTRIACLRNEGDKVMRRLGAYRDGLRAAGIEPRRQWERSFNAPEVNFYEAARTAMAEWLRDGWDAEGCTAMVAHNDETAVGVMDALAESGKNVPLDVSVIGFDGTEVSEYCRPRLTTVEVPLREIGRQSVELLLRQMADPTAAIQHVTVPTRLRLRESSAPPGNK